MMSACDLVHVIHCPIGQDVSVLGDLEADLPKSREDGSRTDYGVEQDVAIAALLGHVEPDTISAQSFVGADCAGRVLDSCAVVVESLPNHDSHSNVLPAHGHIAAPGKNCTQEPLPSREFDSAPHYYGWLFRRGTGFATGTGAI
jgi:hypothetical protein